MVRQNIGPRISEHSRKFLEEKFDTPTGGAAFILDAFPSLYRRTMVDELRGKFTASELSLLIDTANGTMITPEIAGQSLLGEITDAIALDRADKKWSVNGETVKEKIRKLTIFQAAVLEVWARAFWRDGEYSQERSVEKYVSVIAGSEEN